MPRFMDIAHEFGSGLRIYGERDVYTLEADSRGVVSLGGGQCPKYRATSSGGRKIIKLPYDYESDGLKDHLNEKLALRALKHPGIPVLYDTQRQSDVPFLAMDYIWGSSLRGRTFDRKQIKSVFIQLCEILDYLSLSEVVHREVKPDNILIVEYPKRICPVLIDFELCVPRGFVEAELLDGTFEYLSPEQFSEDRLPLDTRSDIYMLGLTLYNTAVGRLPFTGRIPNDTIYFMKRDNLIPHPKTVCPEIDPLLADIIMKAIKADRGERYQTPSEMIADLRRIPD